MTPLVSVVLPVYNAEEYISEALKSILNQTYDNLEVVVVNDGSTDHSLHVIRSLADKRVKIISRENRGLVASLNEGIDAASGDYIARMDADDISHPERISKQIRLLEE